MPYKRLEYLGSTGKSYVIEIEIYDIFVQILYLKILNP